MVALSRGLASLALFVAGVDGARVAKKRAAKFTSGTKFIGGVPVANYHAAYGGHSNLATLEADAEEEWILMLKEGATDAQIKSLCQAARKGCKISGHPSEKGVPFLDMKGTEKDVEAVVKASGGAVKFIEPEQILEAIPELDEAEPESKSWGLDRVGAKGRGGNMGEGVSIYILDTGVRSTHQDFGSRASPKVDFTTSDTGDECNGDLNCAADRQGHGTHCAGSAAGTSFGVASKATVYGVKVLGDSGGGGLAGILGSIDYIATNEARPAIGSMSLGGPCPAGFCGLLSVVKDAVDAAVQAGVTIVVAGGNSNSDACGFMPAFVPTAITVGSTDSKDARSYFSNFGKCTDIWAPGSDITSASHEDDTGSKTFSGTSMACPHVAGGAALVLETHPKFSSEQVIDKLLANGAKNYITDLKFNDVNTLLYIDAKGPPPPGNVTAPPQECPGYCVLCFTEACKGCC